MTDSGPRRPTRVSRRAYLAGLGTGVLAGLAGCSAGSFPDGLVAARGTGDAGATADGWRQRTKLTLTDADVQDFGSSVALSSDGTTALVSATEHRDADGWGPGPAYVLQRVHGEWRKRAELTPDVGDRDAGFIDFGGKGGSTALSADASTALVGAERADEPNGAEAGAAFVFERADGGWDRQARLLPDDGDRKDFFGKAVALSGDGRTALVGAWGNDHPRGDGAGAAYVYRRAGGDWRQRATLRPVDGDGVGAFGWSVAVSRDATTAFIGAPGDDSPGGENAGSTYVFQRADGVWRRGAKLTPDDGTAGDFFGGSIALRGATAVVGAPEDDDPHGDRGGSAYVFERAAGSWRQQAKLVADDGDPIDLFGVAVALSPDASIALVGARVDEDPHGENAGSAYVFRRAGGGWHQRTKLVAADGQPSDVFGRSVALSDDTAFVGTNRGKAYVFGRE